MKLILASASPRRKELLKLIGLKFEIKVSEVKERECEANMSPSQYAMSLAKEKALQICSKENEGLVIGADTIVILNGEVLGKPVNEEEAFNMLKALSGKNHRVVTGIHIQDIESEKSLTDFEITNVEFDKITDEEIKKYIETKEPMDKAGAYGIQGIGAKFIKNIEGCYFNVVGLPLNKLKRMLQELGHNI